MIGESIRLHFDLLHIGFQLNRAEIEDGSQPLLEQPLAFCLRHVGGEVGLVFANAVFVFAHKSKSNSIRGLACLLAPDHLCKDVPPALEHLQLLCIGITDVQSGFYFFNQPAQRVQQTAGKGLALTADNLAHDLFIGQQPRLDKLGNDLAVDLRVVKPGIELVLGALRRAKIYRRRALSGKRVENKIAQLCVQPLALQQVRVFMRHRGENAPVGLCPEVDYPVNGAAVEIRARVDEQDLPAEHLREPLCRRTFLGGNTMFKCTALGRVQIGVRFGIAPPGFKDAPRIRLADHGVARKVKGVPPVALPVIRAEVGVVKLGRREQGVPRKSAQLVFGNARVIARIIDGLPGGADRSTHLFARVRGLQRRHTRISACVAQLLRRKGLHGFQMFALFGECAGQLLAGQRLKGIRKRLGFCDFVRAAVGQLAGKHVAEVRVRLRLRPFRRRLARYARRICRPELRL